MAQYAAERDRARCDGGIHCARVSALRNLELRDCVHGAQGSHVSECGEAITVEIMKTLKILVNLALVGLLVWFLVSHEQKIRATVATRDSIQYWATGTLLLRGQNPYSVASVQALESSQGWAEARPLMLRTPPWSVWMVLPEGLFSSFWAGVVWLAVLFA